MWQRAFQVQSISYVDNVDLTNNAKLQKALRDVQGYYQDLSKEYALLKDENSELKSKVDHLSMRIATSELGVSVANLPNELLLLIMRNCVPPSWMLAAEGSIHSYDLAAKLALAMVCRRWNHVSTELLYNTVHLHRIGQLPAFVRSLEGRPALRALVRHLQVSCFVPQGYDTLFESEMRILLDLSPRIFTLAFSPVLVRPNRRWRFPALTSTNIVHLQLSRHVGSEERIAALVSLSDRLLSLDIPFSPHPTVLHLPVLADLQVDFDATEEMTSDDIWDWTMPALRRLWLTTNFRATSRQPAHAVRTALRLTRSYGEKLVFLSLLLHYTKGELQDILDQCPMLHHLVLSPVLSSPATATLHHAQIRFIDIWVSWVEPFRISKTGCVGLLEAPGLCSLRLCRRFDATFLCYGNAIPILFPPDHCGLPARGEIEVVRPISDDRQSLKNAVTASDSSHRLPSWLSTIIQFSNFMGSPWGPEDFAKLDLQECTCEDHEDSPDCSLDPTDDTGSVSSDSDSSTVSQVGDAVRLQDEFHVEEDEWQVDRDEALAIFSDLIHNPRHAELLMDANLLAFDLHELSLQQAACLGITSSLELAFAIASLLCGSVFRKPTRQRIFPKFLGSVTGVPFSLPLSTESDISRTLNEHWISFGPVVRASCLRGHLTDD
ncbi:hypothetical protein C8F01DRAFT_1075975 [Mycena amicta]|nr:hypothetical protein C8F01DRAFT_1075975 [Mycena amicta]